MDKIIGHPSGYYSPEACDVDAFKILVEQIVEIRDVPRAKEVLRNVPIYDMQVRACDLQAPDTRCALMAEWAQILKAGAGVFVLRGVYADKSAIDAATALFEQIIIQEKAASGAGADHFAAAGNNDRIWNTLQKLCEASPEIYLRYHGNAAIDAACEAWLGPNYQMTAQINVVRPGGQAQQAHRDYHLGFQSAEVSAAYPAHVHDLSPLLTLQGGIAHVDIPLESGPTKLLPFSQTYRPGYTAWRRADFRAVFEEHHVQIALKKGDALFFNPALFHAAGANVSTDIHRMVNLLQVSSPFGRAMETVDRVGMCQRVFEPLKRLLQDGVLSDCDFQAAIAATAEGYSFPTNLDTDPPSGGLAPQTQAALLLKAVKEQWSAQDFSTALSAQEARKQA